MVQDRSRVLNWVTTPIERLTVAGSRRTSTPSTSTVPPVGTTLVVATPTVVVLPAPLGPSRPNSSPSRIVRSIPSTALGSPDRP